MSCVQLLYLVRIQHVWLERIVFRALCGGVRSLLSIVPNGTSLHSIHAQHVVPCVTMPLNTAQYLTKHGWEGHGKPLDGERGRGLKKPLMIPKKRNLGGIGQDRDRAVEWWDDVFAVRTICSL